ncbi:MAG: cytochrome b/b6 domain-containing protein, partial [Gammaproteobacteria bacterium]
MNNISRYIIWDLPTRVFHWLVVAAFAVAWLTYDDNRFLYVHVFSGYVLLGLLVFRLIWGFIGTHYARFHTFAHDWKSVTEYLLGLLNGKAMRHIGHNPAGGWAIFLMLALGLGVGITGVLTLGGEEGHGLLAGYVNYTVGIISREIHEYAAWTMLGLVVIHLLGVVVESLIHKDNLIWAMITGHKEADAGVASVHGHHLLGLLIVTLISVSSF